MNRIVLVIGLFAVVLAFLYIPYDVPNTSARMMAELLFDNRSSATELAYGFLWEKPDSEAVINRTLWHASLGGLAFVTLVLAFLVTPSRMSNPGNKPREEPRPKPRKRKKIPAILEPGKFFPLAKNRHLLPHAAC